MSVEKDLVDRWSNCCSEILDKVVLNFAEAFADMDKATIEYPAICDLSKIDFKKQLEIGNPRKLELSIRLEHPVNIKTQIKDFIEWSRL